MLYWFIPVASMTCKLLGICIRALIKLNKKFGLRLRVGTGTEAPPERRTERLTKDAWLKSILATPIKVSPLSPPLGLPLGPAGDPPLGPPLGPADQNRVSHVRVAHGSP